MIGVYTFNGRTNFQYPLYTFADCLMHVAVIVFVLITGYFGIHFRIHKVFALEAELIYYSVIASSIAFFCLQTVHIKDLILSFFPVTRHVYWFMSAYMELYLVSPLVNKLLERLSKRQFIYLLAVLGFSYCVLFNGDTFNAGTNLTGFTFLYVLGRFIRQYRIYEREIEYKNSFVLPGHLCSDCIGLLFSSNNRKNIPTFHQLFLFI